MALKSSKRTRKSQARPPAGAKAVRRGLGTASRTVKKGLKRKPARKLEFDAFADGYLDAALFADLPEGCDGTLDIFPGCIPQILKDCQRFQRENRRLPKRLFGDGRRAGFLVLASGARDRIFLSRLGRRG